MRESTQPSQVQHDRWGRGEAAAVVVLWAVIAFLRLWNLEADPPLRLTHSNDVYSDGALYTYYAREFVRTGSFDPSGDERFGIFKNSTVTPLAIGVFTLFGVGLWQSNLVGVLFGLGALFFFYLFVRRIAGVAASLWFLLLSGLSYNLVFFGRQPFLENAMAFWGFLSLVLATYGRRGWVFFLAGLCLGAAALFSKIHGLIFVFPSTCFLLWRLLFDDPRLPKLAGKSVTAFAAGYVGSIILWVLIVYLPAPTQLTSFFRENTIELHGAPKGLTSLSDFVEKALTFGYDTEFFPRLVVVGLLGAVFLGGVFYQLCRRETYRGEMTFGNGGWIFIGAMIIAFFFSLMIWNYRPLRYQLILTFPFCAGAAILIDRLWQGVRPLAQEKTPRLFWLFCAAVAVIPSYQVFAGGSAIISAGWWGDVAKIAVPLSAVLIPLAVGVLMLTLRRQHVPPSHSVTRVLAVMLAVGGVFGSVVGYANWAARSTFTVRDVNRDVAFNVGPGALLTGPYAQVMSMENNLPSLVHMFGVARPDPDFFSKFPITHVLIDDGNIARLYEDYPEVMKRHEHICTYFIGETKVRLINVSRATGNPSAASYINTPLENAIIRYRNQDTAMARAEIGKFTPAHPLNFAGNLFTFEMTNVDGDWAAAEAALKKAVEFSPTSYVLNARLGRFYRDRARALGSGELHRLAARYYEEAVRLAPTAERTVDEYLRFKEDRTWQNSVDTTL